jgi:hypothetical protein
MGRRFRPGLQEVDGKPRPFLRRSLSFYKRTFGEETPFPTVDTYKELFRFLAFIQAVAVTALIITLLGHPPDNIFDFGILGLAFAAWPVTGLKVLPAFMRRLTILSSIDRNKNDMQIRKGMREAKEGLLRDFVRLVQLTGFERRAALKGEPWTKPGMQWSHAEARAMVSRGVDAFQGLTKTSQWEVWQLFAAADPNNDGIIEVHELDGFVEHILGNSVFSDSDARTSALNIVRLVDYDDQGTLSWEKFQAALMIGSGLSESDGMHRQALSEDIERFYDSMALGEDASEAEGITVLRLAECMQMMRLGLSCDDVSNLIYRHFNTAKNRITKSELVELVVPYGGLEVDEAVTA